MWGESSLKAIARYIRLRSPAVHRFLVSVYDFIKLGSPFRLVRLDRSPLWPNSSGPQKLLTKIFLSSQDQLPTLTEKLIRETGLKSHLYEFSELLDRFGLIETQEASASLRTYFDNYQSDKSRTHGYERLYSALFDDPAKVQKVVEVGIGGTNEKIPSNRGKGTMGSGGSLRAFAEFYPRATITGLDVDRDTFFTEGRINCFFYDQTEGVDQLEQEGFEKETLDLFIDDGLHLFGANLNTLRHGLWFTRVDGFIVIEDITKGNLGMWMSVSQLLEKSGNDSGLCKFGPDYALLVRKRSASSLRP